MTCKLINYDSPYLDSLNISESEISKVNAYIEAATTAIEKATHRSFGKSERDEAYKADQDGSIVLDVFPVKHVDRLYSTTRECLKIQNTDSTVTNASYNTTESSLRLSHTAGGSNTTTELLFADNLTINALKTAIDAIGSGWTAIVQGDYGPFATSDLVRSQYGEAKYGATSLRMWAQTGARWTLVESKEGLIVGEFSRGQEVRVVYTAGFAASAIPEDIKQVCAELVAEMMGDGDASLQSESLGGYSYSLATGALSRLPRSSREIIGSYKDRLV